MKLLIDTNIFIPLEPTSPDDLTAQTALAARLCELATRQDAQLWLHPAQRVDIAQDGCSRRRNLREALFAKYPTLKLGLPPIPTSHTNDWVDSQLLLALERNAVGFLVSDDRALKRKAASRLVGERILNLQEAVSFLAQHGDSDVEPPPAVHRVPVYDLDVRDPFWDSFRQDYAGFDVWFAKCQSEHRSAWTIRQNDTEDLAGCAILNEERTEIRGRKTLKICSFKIAPAQRGRRYGELLLKSIFMHAFENHYDSLYISAFPKHETLVDLLLDFGFISEERETGLGEMQFHKLLALENPTEPTLLKSLDYFIREGPFSFSTLGSKAYVVPILPKFHRMLFPDLQLQAPLLAPSVEAHGNAMKKAYLSRSSVRPPAEGAILFFYRSEDAQAVDTWGIVEVAKRSSDPEELCDFVMPRTVFSREEIRRQCEAGSVLAIMFRQCLRKIKVPVALSELRGNGVVSSAPQSLVGIDARAKRWMVNRCQRLS